MSGREEVVDLLGSNTGREGDLNKWKAHEIERGLQLSSVSRSLNSIRACLNHAQKNNEDLQNYRVPNKNLKKRIADKHRETRSVSLASM